MWPEPVSATLEYLRSGGIVTVPLAAISIWMWTLVFRKYRQVSGFSRTLSDLRAGEEETEAVPATKAPWLERLRRGHTGDARADARFAEVVIGREVRTLREHIPTILVLASVAPLFGLLGTVTGMVFTFEAISRFGTGNARALASGISEALITTQVGLVVAVPGFLLGNFLNRRVQRIETRLRRVFLRTLKDAADRPLHSEATEEAEES